MNEELISMEEMIAYIYDQAKNINCEISKDAISLILDLQEEFLASKGLIEIEEFDDDEY